jgi:hypothetical protein
MTKRQRSQYQMFVRVRDFGITHAVRFPEGSEGSKAFAAVTAAVADIDAFNKQKQTGRRDGQHEKLAVKQALVKRLRTIASSARVLGRTVPGADAKFPPLTRTDDVSVLQSGRLFLQEAEPVKDSFIRCGLPTTFVDDLQQAVTRFEQTIAGNSAGRIGAIVSGKGISATITQGIQTVRALDVLVANVLDDDQVAMNTWKRQRHVDLTGGKSVPVGEPSDEPVPVEGDPLAPHTAEVSASVTSAANEPLRRAS